MERPRMFKRTYSKGKWEICIFWEVSLIFHGCQLMQNVEKEKRKRCVPPATLWKTMKALCSHGNKKNPYKTQITLFCGGSKKQSRHRAELA